jgi:hypothetical protein
MDRAGSRAVPLAPTRVIFTGRLLLRGGFSGAFDRVDLA